MKPSSTSTKLDKAAARKLANRESAKNSYLKKKEYVKNLENENAELKEEVKRLREVGERMRKAMVAMQEKQLLLEDVGVGGLDNHGHGLGTHHHLIGGGGGGLLPLFHSGGSTAAAAAPPPPATPPVAVEQPNSNAAQRKRRRRGVTEKEFGSEEVLPSSSSSSYPTSSTVSRTSSPSIVKLATIPIIAISSTLCYVDNTSQLEPARLGGAMSMVGSSIVSVNFLVLIGLVAVVCMYFMFDFDKIKEQRKSIGVKRRLFGKY